MNRWEKGASERDRRIVVAREGLMSNRFRGLGLSGGLVVAAAAALAGGGGGGRAGAPGKDGAAGTDASGGPDGGATSDAAPPTFAVDPQMVPIAASVSGLEGQGPDRPVGRLQSS